MFQTKQRHAAAFALRRRPRAISLLELLAVMIIVGIIAAVAIPRLGGHTGVAKGNVCRQYKADLNDALERYYFDTETWATDMMDIQSDNYYPSAIPVCPVTGQAYEIDPTTHRIMGHNH